RPCAVRPAILPTRCSSESLLDWEKNSSRPDFVSTNRQKARLTVMSGLPTRLTCVRGAFGGSQELPCTPRQRPASRREHAPAANPHGPVKLCLPKETQLMDAPSPIARPSAESELLIQTQSYLTRREHSQPPSQDLEAAWRVFYDLYGGKIRAYACTCGVAEEDIADCVQEIWCELLVRLPTFQLDPCRGQFDTWLFTIVRSKTADLHRSRKRRLLQGNSE